MENFNTNNGSSGQWTIAKRLSIAFAAMVIIVATIGVTSYWGVGQLSNNIEEVGVVNLPSVASALRMELQLTELSAAQRTLLVPGIDLATRQYQYDRIEEAGEAFNRARTIYEPLPRTPEEERYWSNVVSRFNELQRYNNDVLTLNRAIDQAGIPDPQEMIADL